MNLFSDPVAYLATKIITAKIAIMDKLSTHIGISSTSDGKTSPPDVSAAMEFMKDWGFWILGIISVIALIACAIFLAIDGMKFYRATSADERNEIKNNMIGKVIGAIIAVSGTVIFNVLAGVLGSK